MMHFWFEFGSTYSYLSVFRVPELARQAGVAVRWRPFLLGPIFREFGWSTSPFNLQPVKGEYMWRDVARLCRKYGLPFARPGTFPQSALLPARLALLAEDEPWLADFCGAVMKAEFGDGRLIDDAALVRDLLHPLVGGEADDWIARAGAPEAKQRLREQTEEARRLGIFGAPTFVVGDELYWGNDRLEDALEHARQAATRPAAGRS